MELRTTQKFKNFFTRAEVAQLFEVAPNTVNRWVVAGRLPSVVTPGGRRRYPVGAILQMIDEQMQGGSRYLPGAVLRIPAPRQPAASQPARALLSRQRERSAANRSRRK